MKKFMAIGMIGIWLALLTAAGIDIQYSGSDDVKFDLITVGWLNETDSITINDWMWLDGQLVPHMWTWIGPDDITATTIADPPPKV